MGDYTRTERMRRYRERKRQGGRKEHHMWLTEAEASAVRDLIERGEDLSAMAARMVKLLDHAEMADKRAQVQHQQAQEAEHRAEAAEAAQADHEALKARLERVEAELADWKENAVLMRD